VLFAFRYFRVLRVVPSVFIGGFIVSTLLAGIQLMSDSSSAESALNPVLKLQLFAASSGFQLPARRGYYDLLLTSSTARWQVAVAHCGVSIAPGLLTWMCVVLLELTVSRGNHAAAASAGTCMAFVAWSIIAWATAVFSSRTAAMILWLVVMSIPGVGYLSPFAWVGANASAIRPLALFAPYAVAIAGFALALMAIARRPTPLEGSQ
jgi:hypothetical protein